MIMFINKKRGTKQADMTKKTGELVRLPVNQDNRENQTSRKTMKNWSHQSKTGFNQFFILFFI